MVHLIEYLLIVSGFFNTSIIVRLGNAELFPVRVDSAIDIALQSDQDADVMVAGLVQLVRGMATRCPFRRRLFADHVSRLFATQAMESTGQRTVGCSREPHRGLDCAVHFLLDL